MKKIIKNIRLSKNVVPKEYFITIQPDISKFSFKGEEEIKEGRIEIVKKLNKGKVRVIENKSYAEDQSKKLVKYKEC